MPEHLHYHDDELFNPETHHEESDVNVKAILWFAVIFVVFGLISHFVVWGLFEQFVSMERKRDERTANLTAVPRAKDAAVPKNQPLLQPFPTKAPNGAEVAPTSNTPVTDLIDMRRRENEALHSYGWVDKQHGVVHIPIEDAKRRALAQLAVSATTTPTAEAAVATPAMATSGAAAQPPGNAATRQPGIPATGQPQPQPHTEAHP
jgi:hypothetical protein